MFVILLLLIYYLSENRNIFGMVDIYITIGNRFLYYHGISSTLWHINIMVYMARHVYE